MFLLTLEPCRLALISSMLFSWFFCRTRYLLAIMAPNNFLSFVALQKNYFWYLFVLPSVYSSSKHMVFVGFVCPSFCHGNIKISKMSFLIMFHINFNCHFLIVTINVIFVSISSKRPSFVTWVIHGVLSNLL